MTESLRPLIESYNAAAPLESAETIPSAWYTDPRIDALERRAVFGATWQVVARVDQLAQSGQYVTTNIGGEPVVVVRGEDGVLHAFYNVCRHHAAEVMTEPAGHCQVMRCPYHAWTYALDGRLKGMPEFEGVAGFDKGDHGLVPAAVETWENFVFVNLSGPVTSPTFRDFLEDLPDRIAPLALGTLRFFERRVYDLACNWKVYVDNYLDGGYHVPHIHKALGSVIDYAGYTIETKGHYCLQWSPMTANDGNADVASVRRGERACYYWLYPNFMINWYEGVMDTNLVLPLSVDRCRVIFDFYFEDVTGGAGEHNRRSLDVGERVQQEDIDICESVQRGLGSRAYDTGRLSVRREAGEQQFHRLLQQYLLQTY